MNLLNETKNFVFFYCIIILFALHSTLSPIFIFLRIIGHGSFQQTIKQKNTPLVRKQKKNEKNATFTFNLNDWNGVDNWCGATVRKSFESPGNECQKWHIVYFIHFIIRKFVYYFVYFFTFTFCNYLNSYFYFIAHSKDKFEFSECSSLHRQSFHIESWATVQMKNLLANGFRIQNDRIGKMLHLLSKTMVKIQLLLLPTVNDVSKFFIIISGRQINHIFL